MRYREIVETMRGFNFEKMAVAYVAASKDEWFKSEPIADLDEYKIRRYKDVIFSVWDNDTCVATCSLEDHVVDRVWVNPEYRGQKIFSKILWFFKTRLGVNPLIMGELHSNQMVEILKGLSRFKKTWRNGKEIVPYSPETLDQFYDFAGPSGWRLFLENNGNFSSWPMFNSIDMMEAVKADYTWQID